MSIKSIAQLRLLYNQLAVQLKQLIRDHATGLAAVLVVVLITAQLALQHHVAVRKLVSAALVGVVLNHVDSWIERRCPLCELTENSFFNGKLRWPLSAYLCSHVCCSDVSPLDAPRICTWRICVEFSPWRRARDTR